MEQRLSLVTLGVRDLERSRRFYGALGWQGQLVEQTLFFQAGGLAVVLWSLDALAVDIGVPAASTGTTAEPTAPLVVLAHNTRQRDEVDRIVAAAGAAGARITKQPEPTFYGGYAGCFADPDGHVWEIAHNPGLPLDAAGNLTVPDFASE